MTSFEAARVRHQQAVAAYEERARRVAHNTWLRERAPGKWSPAAITQHLIMALDTGVQEMSGGAGMVMRLSGLKLWLARTFILRRILRDGRFPGGARAPRETRPQGELPPQAEGLRNFLAAAEKLDAAAVKAHETKRDVRITHPYFGALNMTDALFLSAKHIEHHTRQLPDGH